VIYVLIWIWTVGAIVIATAMLDQTSNRPRTRLARIGVVLFFLAWPITFSGAILAGVFGAGRLK